MARRLTVAGVVLGAYLLANLAHGVPHAAVPVPLTPFQTAFVVLVVTVAPVAGFVLAWRGAERVGWIVFSLSMAASFAFGVYHHFLVPNPDNVRSVGGSWHSPFLVTAVLVAVAGFGGIVAGARFVRSVSRTGEDGPLTEG